MCRFAVLILTVLLFSGCATPPAATKLRIAAAASVQFLVKALAEDFSEYSGIATEVISASSGKITTQILHGAPFDIFFAADLSYPELLVQRDRVVGSTHLYGYGIPVLWTTYENLDLEDVSAVLMAEGINKIAIADPKNAPYGKMAIKFLVDQGLSDRLSPKLVYGESISQVNEYVLNKHVELAIGAKSVVASPRLTGIGNYRALENKYWIAQGMVLLKNSSFPEEQQEFLGFLFSEPGQAVLDAYGLEKVKK